MKLSEEIKVTVSSVAYLCLHHGWSLRAQHLYGLKHVDDSLVPHPLQHDAQCDEYSRPAHSSTENKHTSRSAHIKVSSTSSENQAHTIINKCQLNEQPKSSTYHSIAAYGKRSKNWGFLTHYAYSLNILFFHRYAVLSYACKFTHVPVQEGQVIDAHVIKKLNNKSIKLSGFISIISLQ